MVESDDVRRAHGFHRLPVKEVVRETDDARSFVLDVPGDLRETFRYRAGQFCTFRVIIDGTQQLRSYSMSSAPETDPDLTVTVKRLPGGRVSNWFNDAVSAGDVLEMTKPAGVFTVREGERPVVGICGGSGVTPVISIAKSVLASSQRSVKLLFANREPASVLFEQTLGDLAAQHRSRFEVQHHFDSDAGLLDAGAIAQFADGSLDADFYLCGPLPFMDLAETALSAAGVDPDRILIERFDAAPAPAEAVATPPDAASEHTEEVTIVLKGTKHRVAYHAGDTVLETARRGGLSPPFSCEAGDCATCMALLQEGSVTMRANNALTPEEVEEGWILTCQSLPQASAVTVEYEDL